MTPPEAEHYLSVGLVRGVSPGIVDCTDRTIYGAQELLPLAFEVVSS